MYNWLCNIILYTVVLAFMCLVKRPVRLNQLGLCSLQYYPLKPCLCSEDKVTVVIIFPFPRLPKLVAILNSSRMASDYVALRSRAIFCTCSQWETEPDAVFVFFCFFVCFLQMVVVSDDVHEYAVALKDTDEKIARCPSRVRPLYQSVELYLNS